MNFDFNKEEKEIIKNICEKIDSLINKDSATLLTKPKNLIDEFEKTGYFQCEGPILNNVRAKLAEKNFSIYYIFEIGKRLFYKIKSYIKDNETELPSKLLIPPAYIEENNNFQIDNINTIVTKKDNVYKINGKKRYVPFLDVVDYILVLAKFEDFPCICLIKKDDIEYIEVKNNFFNDINFFDITLNDVKIDREHMLSLKNNKSFLDLFFYELNNIAISGAIGLINGAFCEAHTFSKIHKNNSRPIISYQEVGFKLAEMKTLMDAANLIASKCCEYKKVNKEAMEIALTAKVFCLESLEKIASSAISILSIHGFFKDSFAHKAYNLSKFLQTLGTSIEVSRVNLGDLLLGYKRF